MDKVITLDHVKYRYAQSTGASCVIQEATGEFVQGKTYAIVGQSGSGKTTLLSLLAGLDHPTEGAIYFKEKNLREIDRDEYRSSKISIIFQHYNLIAHYTAIENVQLGLTVNGYPGDMNKKSVEILEQVGINRQKAHKRSVHLSGGEQQRVAIARALVSQSDLVLADEPTGNLDEANQEMIIDLLKKIAHEEKKCVIIVTHSKEVAASCDEIWTIQNGRLLPLKVE
ncbi:ABC transporter ATP-binding protein [Brevibacillus ruminantium]|uniref:ABC transporter ATP-binding protein n=1 Tax=Brevibacillus ruminantium TaxID=2950604 RepID=A0ABY4WLG1_9BACL|nr:ABC transporter ATP-binding protein [Brevibacillus ruminantium]USG66214.1 ABC transporter ATP-binding protein [Brevibacillus ruminantium]